MRILLSAFACSPDRGSEPGVGWNWASRLCKDHEVHVLTADWFRDALDSTIKTNSYPGLRIHYVPTRTTELTAHTRRFIGWLLYYDWQWRAYKLASKLHKEHHFDLAHHVTFASWRVSSFLWKLPIPFIWGPLGGGQMSPKGFLSMYSKSGMFIEVMRMIMQRISAYDPVFKKAIHRSAYVLGANTDTVKFLNPFRDQNISYMCETAYTHPILPPSPGLSPNRRQKPRESRCRLLWVGGLEPRKALPLALYALARMPDKNEYELVVIGHGKEESRLRRLVTNLGLSEQVFFRGALPYIEVQKSYLYADIFVFTSLRETSGNVIFEAMGASLPIVCLNWSGPKDLTDDRSAIRIEPYSPDQVIQDLADTLQRLHKDEALRLRMGKAGNERLLRNFTWETKVEAINTIYQELTVSRHARRENL